MSLTISVAKMFADLRDLLTSLKVGTDPGNIIAIDNKGRLPALDGSLLTNLAVPVGVLPVLTIELGNSAQDNGSRGIDRGNWYQLDFRIGTSVSNGFKYTANDDGTITIPSGVYLVAGNAKVIAPQTDNYLLPAQMTFAAGMYYGYPGVYQNAIQQIPDVSTGNARMAGTLGSINVCGVQSSWGPGSPLWMGFDKVLGSENRIPLSLQGYMSIVKIG